jgi:hypothetical protein
MICGQLAFLDGKLRRARKAAGGAGMTRKPALDEKQKRGGAANRIPRLHGKRNF